MRTWPLRKPLEAADCARLAAAERPIEPHDQGHCGGEGSLLYTLVS